MQSWVQLIITIAFLTVFFLTKSCPPLCLSVPWFSNNTIYSDEKTGTNQISHEFFTTFRIKFFPFICLTKPCHWLIAFTTEKHEKAPYQNNSCSHVNVKITYVLIQCMSVSALIKCTNNKASKSFSQQIHESSQRIPSSHQEHVK